jgi:excisionase family DNA binding protein
MSAKTKPAANGKVAATTPTAVMSPLDVLTLAEAAAYLRLTEEVVRAEAEGGRLPGRSLGGEWRFTRGAIADWLAAPPVPTPESVREGILALSGVWKDDPTVDPMIEEIYRQRKANPVGGR